MEVELDATFLTVPNGLLFMGIVEFIMKPSRNENKTVFARVAC